VAQRHCSNGSAVKLGSFQEQTKSKLNLSILPMSNEYPLIAAVRTLSPLYPTDSLTEDFHVVGESSTTADCKSLYTRIETLSQYAGTKVG
jgi:hypothetical protein